MKRFFIAVLIAILSLPSAFALSVDDIPRQSVRPDFVIFPARQEVRLAPGDQTVKRLTIINRLKRQATFVLNVEDLNPTDNPRDPLVLAGEDRGLYSLKNYLTLSDREVVLDSGETATIQISINLTEQTPPGGLHGAVTVTATYPSEQSATKFSTRAGSLFFVRVEGPVKESGRLIAFGLNRGHFLWSTKPITFNFSYQNGGNVYLDPYGRLTIRNVFGQSTAVLPIDPWFVLPQTTRLRELIWRPGYRFGFYRVVIEQNRGYANQIDQKNTWFVIIPWPFIVGVGIFLFSLWLKRRVLK